MSDMFVTILGGRYLTNGKIVKSASPHTLNPHPIAQVVVGGHVGYHLQKNGRKVFYSLALIEDLYKDSYVEKKPFKIKWRYVIIAISIILLLSVTTCDVTIDIKQEQTANETI